MRPHALRDDQWNRIRDGLPGRAGSVGVTAADNRRFVDAVIHRYRTGIPWRDLPAGFGDWNNTHRRHSRWAERVVWAAMFALLATDADNEYAMIGSTIVRAHQHSAGAKKSGRRPGDWPEQRGPEPQDSPHFYIAPKVSANTGTSASISANFSINGRNRLSGMVGIRS